MKPQIDARRRMDRDCRPANAKLRIEGLIAAGSTPMRTMMASSDISQALATVRTEFERPAPALLRSARELPTSTIREADDRRQLVNAATRPRDEGKLPENVDNVDFDRVRSASLRYPAGSDWRTLSETARAAIPQFDGARSILRENGVAPPARASG
jgi:hypothetical protein